MKTSLLIVCAGFAGSLNAQRNLVPKMNPIYEPGYYVSQRNDTIRGEIQTNVENELEYYDHFYFKAAVAGKARRINGQRAKAYGFGGRHFVQTVIDNRRSFYERLVSGRLRFYEYKRRGRIDGYDAVVSDFFIRDTQAEPSKAELKVSRRLPQKLYKKALKPYMSEQPMIWSDLDKFEFNPEKIVQALTEFNQYYRNTAN